MLLAKERRLEEEKEKEERLEKLRMQVGKILGDFNFEIICYDCLGCDNCDCSHYAAIMWPFIIVDTVPDSQDGRPGTRLKKKPIIMSIYMKHYCCGL